MPGPSSVASHGHLCRAFAYHSVSFHSHAIADQRYPMPLHCWSIQCLRRATRRSAVQFLRTSYPSYAIPLQCYSLVCLGESLRSVPEPLLLCSLLCPCDAVHLLAKPLPVSSFHAGQCLCFSKLGDAFADQCGARPFRAVPWPCSISYSMPLPFIAPFGPAVPLQCLALPFHAWLCLRMASPRLLCLLAAFPLNAMPLLRDPRPIQAKPLQIIAIKQGPCISYPDVASPCHCAAPRGKTVPFLCIDYLCLTMPSLRKSFPRLSMAVLSMATRCCAVLSHAIASHFCATLRSAEPCLCPANRSHSTPRLSKPLRGSSGQNYAFAMQCQDLRYYAVAMLRCALPRPAMPLRISP